MWRATLLRKGGGYLPAGITYAPLFDRDGHLVNFIANVRDITKFREAEELKSTFISIVSHELRTPVSLIKGYAETLLREDARWDAAVVRDSLAVIDEEADRLAEMIENLLDASRLQAGAMRMNMAELALDKLAERLVEKLAPAADGLAADRVVDGLGRPRPRTQLRRAADRREGAAELVTVHDLTCVHHPELCTTDTLRVPGPDPARPAPGCAPACGLAASWPTRSSTSSLSTATGSMSCRTASTVHIRATPPRVALGRGPITTSSPSARSSLARTCRRSSTPSTRSRPAIRRPLVVVAGPDGWGVEAFDAAVGEPVTASRIIRLGWVDDQARADLVAGAIVFAYPSKYEGFGLPPLEAMAAARPWSRRPPARSRRCSATPPVSSRPATPTRSPARCTACSTTAPSGSDSSTAGTRTRRAATRGMRAPTGVVGHLPATSAKTPNGARPDHRSQRLRRPSSRRASRAEGDTVEGCDRDDGSIDIDDRGVDRPILQALRARGRVPPRRMERRRRLVDERRRRRSERTPTGTLNLLLACKDAGVERVLSVSSADVYGIVVRATSCRSTRTAPLRPVTPYAASKVAADYLGLQAWLGWKLPVLRVRAFNHLGPGQSPKFVAPALAERIAQQRGRRRDRSSRSAT